MEQKRCISSLTMAELTAELKALGQPGFRAKQIFHWVHQKLVTEFSAMTDQPKTLLAKLEETFYIAAPQIERRQEAKDGTVKYLLRMADGNCIETVVMRYHYGNTVCISSEVRTIERMKAAGITDIVECGPGKVLTGLLRRTAPEINGHNIFDAASLAAVLEKLN